MVPKMLNNSKYHAHSDADSRIRDIMKLEEITISENPPSPCHKIMTVDAGVQCDLADICLEEGVIEKNYPPREKLDEEEKSTISYADHEFPFPPVLKRDENGSLMLLSIDTNSTIPDEKEFVYDSDDTCGDYVTGYLLFLTGKNVLTFKYGDKKNPNSIKNKVECHENGLCKCQKMRDGEYYEYYTQSMDRNLHTKYPQGKCLLPKGAIFHFTGGPEGMKREDVKQALVALGAKVEFVDFEIGRKEGWARLSYPYEAKIIIKRMIDKKLKIAGAELTFRVLTKKDEKRYLKKTIEAIYQLHKKSKGLDRKLKKAGYKYVTKYDPDNDSGDDS